MMIPLYLCPCILVSLYTCVLVYLCTLILVYLYTFYLCIYVLVTFVLEYLWTWVLVYLCTCVLVYLDGCTDLHTVQPCKLLFGTVMCCYHMDRNTKEGMYNPNFEGGHHVFVMPSFSLLLVYMGLLVCVSLVPFWKYTCKFGLHKLSSYNPMGVWTPHTPMLHWTLRCTVYCTLYCTLYCTINCTQTS